MCSTAVPQDNYGMKQAIALYIFSTMRRKRKQELYEGRKIMELAGAILGGTGGLIVGAAKGIVTGNLTGNQLWKCYTAGAIGGATIGAYTPV